MSTDDPLDSTSPAGAYWTTANVAENIPGVPTPLTWSVWKPAFNKAARFAFSSIGAIPVAERDLPHTDDNAVVNVFLGRVATKVDYLCEMGDRIPGTSGEAVVAQFFSHVPPGFVSSPQRRRYPIVAAKLPVAMVKLPRLSRRGRLDNQPWWTAQIAKTPTLDLEGARRQLEEGRRRFEYNLAIQTAVALACIQPAFDQLSRLLERSGAGTELMAGYGSHEETASVVDLWEVARDRLPMTDFLAKHGFRGPGEGELSSRVWREDPAPLHALLEGYRRKPESADPARAEQESIVVRRRAEADLLAGLPAARRPQARVVLALAHTMMPLRGVGKVAFVQSLDVIRAATRRSGTHLTDAGVLADPEDAFLLTADELVRVPDGLAELIAFRRERREYYRSLRLPSFWQGAAHPLTDEEDTAQTVITGVGASPGTVEGIARVVTDPGTDEVVEGDILVAHTTDPSWASAMFLSSALVVDIGGLLSHAAVVARELGVPCVMDTKTGTRVLRSGDRIRVDGRAGTVEVLELVAPR